MNNETAVILEGGGMRGIYTAGILDVLMENDIYFDSCYAVSAGACHATSYVSRQKGRSLKVNLDYVNDWRYLSKRSLLLTGDMFGAKFSYHTIPEKLIPFDYEAFRQNPMKLYAVVTNVETGKAEYLLVKDAYTDIDMVRASASLPIISRIVNINGKKYLDGGIADSIPIEKSVSDGHKKSVVVLTQHKGFVKQPTSMAKQIEVLYKKYPAFVTAVKTRHERYNNALRYIEEGEKNGTVFAFRPKEPVNIGRMEKNYDKLKALYNEGVADALERIDELKQFLKGDNK